MNARTARHLEGKTALVTGSVQGVGLAIAEALAEAGARIVLHGLDDPDAAGLALDRIEKAGAPEARFFGGDLREPEAIERLMSEAEDWGGVDVLVNNAGIQRTMPLVEVSSELWSDILR